MPRYRVAKLGGGHRTFSILTNAAEFAASQARQSLTSNGIWTITNTRTGRMAQVDENACIEWQP